MTDEYLRRAYQLLQHAYPARRRRERGEVELDTLLAVSRPGQRLPRLAEARAIVREGLRERARTTGASTLEIVAHGSSLGVLFTMALQVFWFAVMAEKVLDARVPRSSGLTLFAAWGLAVLLCAYWWSLRPSRAAIAAWQLSNLIGAGCLVSYIQRYATEGGDGLGAVVATMISVHCLLTVSAVVLLGCWSRIRVSNAVRLGWKVPTITLSVVVWSSPLVRSVESHGSTVLVVAFLTMVLCSFIDPRILVGLASATLTPLVAASLSIIGSDASSSRIRLLFPTGVTLAIGLVVLRVRVLVRRVLC